MAISLYEHEEGVSGYRRTPAAQRDLSSIWDLTQERWSVDAIRILHQQMDPSRRL